MGQCYIITRTYCQKNISRISIVAAIL
jgi:hypothetical protein